MSNTLKYLLIGGAALGVVVVVSNKMQRDAASQPKGIMDRLKDAKAAFTSAASGGGFSYSAPTSALPSADLRNAGGLPWGPSAGSDGYAAVSDATGVRQLHSIVPAQATFMTDRQAAIAGVF
jgi:hypothetical protein